MSDLSNSLAISDDTPCRAEEAAQTASPFNFHIVPNVSMGRTPAIAMLCGFAVPVTGLAIMAAALGYWPVSLFGALWFVAFVLAVGYSRLSLRRHEQVFLQDSAVVVRRTSHAGRSTRTSIPTYGLQLESLVDPDYGLLRLTLRHRSSRVEIARDLSPHERSSFQAAFVAAMHAAGHSMQLITLRAPASLAPESTS